MDIDLQILNALEEEKKPIDYKKLRITPGAFEKIKTYAKLLSKVTPDDLECYGYPLVPEDSLDGVIRDAILAGTQSVSGGYVGVDANGVAESINEVETKGYEIVGWWHCHGGFSVFHSGTDITNFELITKAVASKTLYNNKKVNYRYDAEKKELVFDNFKIKNIEIGNKKENPIEIIGKYEKKPHAHSLVVNKYGDYYIEYVDQEWDERKKEFKPNKPIVNPGLELVSVEDDIEFDILDLEREINEKISMHRNGRDYRTHNYNGSKRSNGTVLNVIEDFVKQANKYITGDGKKKQKIRSLLESPNFFESLSSEGKEEYSNSVNKVMHIQEQFKNANLTVINNPTMLLSYDQYSNLLGLQFMLDFKRKKNKDRVIEEYSSKAKILKESFEKAKSTATALSKYAMERLTDYKGKFNHKYKNLVLDVLNNLRTCDSFLESAKKELYQRESKRCECEFFLYEDRLRFVNLFMDELYSIRTSKEKTHEQKYTLEFLNIFGDIYYENVSKVDDVIENYLLPINRINEDNYVSFTDANRITELLRSPYMGRHFDFRKDESEKEKPWKERKKKNKFDDFDELEEHVRKELNDAEEKYTTRPKEKKKKRRKKGKKGKKKDQKFWETVINVCIPKRR